MILFVLVDYFCLFLIEAITTLGLSMWYPSLDFFGILKITKRQVNALILNFDVIFIIIPMQITAVSLLSTEEVPFDC